MERIRNTSITTRRFAVLVVLVLVGTGITFGIQAAIARTAGPDVYLVKVAINASGGQLAPLKEWVAPSTGAWERVGGGQLAMYDGRRYVVVNEQTKSVYHRIGSPRFLGYLGSADMGVQSLRAALSPGHQGFRASPLYGTKFERSPSRNGFEMVRAGRKIGQITILRKVSMSRAHQLHLFDVGTGVKQGLALDTERQVQVGSSSSIVRGYWFGRRFRSWKATAQMERIRKRSLAEIEAGVSPRVGMNAVFTLYELPSARGHSSVEPAQVAPAGELVVGSQPIGSPVAQKFVNALNGSNGDAKYPAWPRDPVTLADGENATVVPAQFDGNGPIRQGFFVLTRDTLINVNGSVALADIPAIASQLRPLG